MEEKRIAEKIRTLRLRRKIMLEDLSSRTGFTKGYLSKLENAKKLPPIPTLSTIARALGREQILQVIFPYGRCHQPILEGKGDKLLFLT